MKKIMIMKQQIVKSAIVALVVVGGVGGVLFLTDNLAEGATKEKTDVEAVLSKNTADLKVFKDKIERSGMAEKRYLEIQARRLRPDMAVTNDGLLEVLREERTRFRLGNFKMVLGIETAATQPELTNENIDVLVRNGVTVEFDAISDVHALSFINDFVKNSPGLVSIKSVEMERKADLSSEVVAQLQTGKNVPLVSTKMQLMLVNIHMKDKTAVPATAGSDTAAKSSDGGGAP